MVTTLSVTGHMDLTDETVPLVRDALRALVAQHRGEQLVGVSCIARGSDTLFAEAVLEAGGSLVVVIPSEDYRERKVKPDHAPVFDRLVAAAGEVLVMSHATADRAAYESANAVLLERGERLVAVWNGQPPGAKGGGTADVVVAAREAGMPVDVVWPEGAARCR